MSKRLARFIAASVALVAVLAPPAPALAQPHERPAHERGSVRVTEERILDLKQECILNPDKATSETGWAATRFDFCLHGIKEVLLLDEKTRQLIGSVALEVWMFAFASDGTRRIDYVISLENPVPSGEIDPASVFLELNYTGCPTTHVTCSGPIARVDTVPGWRRDPAMPIVIAESPNGSGDGRFKTVEFIPGLELSAAYPGANTASAHIGVAPSRFDSAMRAVGNGKHNGAVFTRNVPVFVMNFSEGSPYRQEVLHVFDALKAPERTFPSIDGKQPPGLKDSRRPLHRLQNRTLQDRNARKAVEVCKDVWGDSYAAGGRECDEYPFQSTYEGASVSTGGDWHQWQGSARPIDGDDNGQGGNALQKFYGENRVLDVGEGRSVNQADAFYIDFQS